MVKLVFISLFLFASVNAFSKKSIRLATLDWKPYVGRNLHNNGFIYEVVKKAFEKVGYDVEISFYPFARAINEAKTGKLDGYFPEYESKELEKNFLFSDPYFHGPVGFVRKKKHFSELVTSPNMQDFSVLKDKRVGVVRGYTNTRAFDAATGFTRVFSSGDSKNLQMLFYGRLDAAFIDVNVANYLLMNELQRKHKGIVDSIEFVFPALDMRKFYTCFTKNNKNSAEYLKDFNLGLSLLIKDGTFQKILEEHNLLYMIQKKMNGAFISLLRDHSF